jgi:hypothetical protein
MIEVVQGDDRTFTFTFRNTAGNVYNLTSCTIFVTVKRNIEDADASALISTTMTVSAPVTGVAVWAIVPAYTKYMLGLYKMDIQFKTSTGAISTVMRDDFYVVDKRTKRIV